MNKRMNPGVGAASILMIFVILCVTVFGILSFSSARSDWKLTQKNAESIQKYYAADAKAQELLRELDTRMIQLTLEHPSIDATTLAKELSKNPLRFIALEETDTPERLAATIPMGELQEIQLEVELSSSPPHYRVVRYQLTPSAEWSGDNQPLPVWQGDPTPDGERN